MGLMLVHDSLACKIRGQYISPWRNPDFEEHLPDEPQQPTEQIESLQKQLDDERDLRREERFFFIIAVVILLDVVFFSVLNTWGGPIALVILEGIDTHSIGETAKN